jgi:Cu(I)/Ag(I) efflux system membrane protein CusA/SilA
MTVATMLFGLVPLLWATGSGADVMKRIAAPMVGGLLTSAFLTLEIIPVIYTWWRLEQLLWERLALLDPVRLARLRWLSGLQSAGWVCAGVALVASFYWDGLPKPLLLGSLAAAGFAVLFGSGAYLAARPAARRLVWPDPAAGGLAALR